MDQRLPPHNESVGWNVMFAYIGLVRQDVRYGSRLYCVWFYIRRVRCDGCNARTHSHIVTGFLFLYKPVKYDTIFLVMATCLPSEARRVVLFECSNRVKGICMDS